MKVYNFIMNNDSKTWFVGNSQLITSLINAYASPEVREQCGLDWKNKRVSKGYFTANDNVYNFLVCGLDVFGYPTVKQGQVSYSESCMKFVQCVDKDAENIIIMLRGVEYAKESIVDTPKYDFSYSKNLAQRGRQFIRKNDILTYYETIINPIIATCILYRASYPNSKCYYVAAPPPIQSESHIIKNPEIFGDLISQYGVRPFYLRLKIYEYMHTILMEKLSNINVELVGAPKSSLTSLGGMREDYAHGCLHGNNLYGQALMALLEREVIYAPI